ncbi:M48 family metalloprotease [Actinopolymorpha sp. B17G11]|uniref:M48 family metalloprotease n=1 Tax=Actinopolymorpha sp. B17G11 TaxID=3160861 RepID=UPI0032E46562
MTDTFADVAIPTPAQWTHIIEMWQDLCAKAGVHPLPPVTFTSADKAGIFEDRNGRATLEVHPDLTDDPPAVQRWILAHELAHYMRRDHVRPPLESVVAAAASPMLWAFSIFAFVLFERYSLAMWVMVATLAGLVCSTATLAALRAADRRAEYAADNYAVALFTHAEFEEAADWIAENWPDPIITGPWATHPKWSRRLHAMREAAR